MLRKDRILCEPSRSREHTHAHTRTRVRSHRSLTHLTTTILRDPETAVMAKSSLRLAVSSSTVEVGEFIYNEERHLRCTLILILRISPYTNINPYNSQDISVYYYVFVYFSGYLCILIRFCVIIFGGISGYLLAGAKFNYRCELSKRIR